MCICAKIRIDGNGSKAISILRKFDPSVSIGELKKRILEDAYVVEYDLLHWDVTEEMAGIDRISKFECLIRSLEECGAIVGIYKNNELIDRTIFANNMIMLREIEQEVNEEMEMEAD